MYNSGVIAIGVGKWFFITDHEQTMYLPKSYKHNLEVAANYKMVAMYLAIN